MRQVFEPMRIGIGVVINKRDDFSGCCFDSRITGVAEPSVFRTDELEIIFSDDLWGGVSGPVIDDDDFVIRVLQLL